MRKTTGFAIATAVFFACISPPPELATFAAREGAVWSQDCCGSPVVEKAPQLPEDLKRRRLTGWVVVSGILDVRGWVTDPIVLAADPPGVFDAVALDAFDGWRYAAPSGAASPRREVRAVIQFRPERPSVTPVGGGGGGGGGGGQPSY
jgi:outer membrane biosynthesis protein TonB